jgi:hypothetical protein
MSAISALKSKIAAKNEEFSKKSQESWRLLEEIARLQQQHDLIRDEMSSLRAEADDLNRKVVRLEEIAAEDLRRREEEAEILASMTPAPALTGPVAEPVPSDLAVFSTVARGSITSGRVKIADFKDFVACGYFLSVDCEEPFRTMSEEDFKDKIKTVEKNDGSGPVGGAAAKKVHTFMKSGAENIGKIIIVAYDKGIGGGGEVRRITGPYRYSPMNTFQHDTIACYFHRFPTAFIRNLTPDEFSKVASTRPPRAINWTTRLLL